MAEAAAPKPAEDDLLRMTAEVVSAYVSNNTLATGQLADVIQAVYNSLRGLEGVISEPAPTPVRPTRKPTAKPPKMMMGQAPECRNSM